MPSYTKDNISLNRKTLSENTRKTLFIPKKRSTYQTKTKKELRNYISQKQQHIWAKNNCKKQHVINMVVKYSYKIGKNDFGEPFPCLPPNPMVNIPEIGNNTEPSLYKIPSLYDTSNLFNMSPECFTPNKSDNTVKCPPAPIKRQMSWCFTPVKRNISVKCPPAPIKRSLPGPKCFTPAKKNISVKCPPAPIKRKLRSPASVTCMKMSLKNMSPRYYDGNLNFRQPNFNL